MARKRNTYCALLRGINVGGKNIIPMAELRACFEELGATRVRTYIQSGNVLFDSTLTRNKTLVTRIEEALSKSFAYEARVVVLEKQEYQEMIRSAHKGWGAREDQKHNAMFLVDQSDAAAHLATLPTPKRGIDTVSSSGSVIFWSAKKDQITRSAMMQVSKLPAYKQMTVRNHKTTYKLAEMLDE